jgi:cell wall assembly regulator SMI1
MELETWLKENAPSVLEALYPGATMSEITRTQEDLGITLPPEVAEFYLRHNGEVGEGALCMGGTLYPLSVMVEQRDMLAAVASTDNDDLVDTSGPVRKNWYNVMWVPFVGADGDDLCLDFAPSAGGNRGQIIFKAREGTRQVIATTFTNWFEAYVKKVVSGAFLYDADEECLRSE